MYKKKNSFIWHPPLYICMSYFFIPIGTPMPIGHSYKHILIKTCRPTKFRADRIDDSKVMIRQTYKH